MEGIMQIQKSNTVSLLLGAILALIVVLCVGWRPETKTGRTTAVSLCCSSNGQTVYAADSEDVYVSRDYGRTWNKIQPK